MAESIYEKIINNTGCAVLVLDSGGNIRFRNRAAADLLGSGIIDEGLLKKLKEPGGNGSFTWENNDKDNRKAAMLWSTCPLDSEEDIICIGAGIRQQTSQALLQDQEREKIAMSERNRLARELHDTVSQNIYSTSLIADILPRIWEKDKKEAMKQLEKIRQLTRGALTEMRMLLLELRPSTFAEEDLESLIRQLSRSVRIRTGILIKVSVEGKLILPLRERLALYRITQEALNNIIRHSSAKNVNILLRYVHDRMDLVIEDDGCGFKSDDILPDNLGLEIMKERAGSIGASIDIWSRPGEGTRISVSLMDKKDG